MAKRDGELVVTADGVDLGEGVVPVDGVGGVSGDPGAFVDGPEHSFGSREQIPEVPSRVVLGNTWNRFAAAGESPRAVERQPSSRLHRRLHRSPLVVGKPRISTDLVVTRQLAVRLAP